MKISKAERKKPTLNYEALKKQGRRHIERLGHRLWTDYNVHDPGITILELLCFAVTDLGYRIEHPIEDLLAESGTDHSPLRTAAEVLPTDPVTERDYRKLLIDLDGVRNAWLKPADEVCAVECRRDDGAVQNEKTAVALSGIWDVLLELDPDRLAEAESIKASARRTLLAHRPLGEDVGTIELVSQQPFLLCADIELAAGADGVEVWARILHEVQLLLTPPVPFRSLDELLDRGVSPAAIFDGPLLVHGFIDDELDRADLTETIRLSDVIRTVMAVAGVAEIRELQVVPAGHRPEEEERWEIPVASGHQPVLDIEHCRLGLTKGGVPCPVDRAAATERLAALTAAAGATSTPGSADLPVPEGRSRKAASYHSFQNHFPAAYGLAAGQLPDSASPGRKAQVRQLKAYLLFFDQLLANFFCQLGRAGRLLSLDGSLRQSYFTQKVDSVADSDELFDNPAGLAEAIQALTEDEELFLRRRHSFLDHLLARFAERFSEYAAVMYSLRGDRSRETLLGDKIRFLEEYPELGRERPTAFDYSDAKEVWNTLNISGFERRVGRLLGIRNLSRRNLANVTYDIYEERDTDTVTEYRFRVIDDSREKILLSGSWKHLVRRDAASEMRHAVTCALDPGSYQRKTARDGRHYFNVVDATGDVVARRIEYFKTAAERDAAIDSLLDLLHARYSEEGMFVVEHLLLRPRRQGDATLPLCPPAGEASCAGLDPYSFRLTIVLPAWPQRFADPAFRALAEQTLRRECPAYLLPRICWIDRGQMGAFEKVFQRWLRALATGKQVTKKNPLNELIATLAQLRSVYPEATLYACTKATAKKKPFLLDRTMLGTLK